jgi:hypothetical protein
MRESITWHDVSKRKRKRLPKNPKSKLSVLGTPTMQSAVVTQMESAEKL